MKIVVTGGAGFIGSHLVDRLVLDRAGEVVVLDNFCRGRLEHLEQSLHQVQIVKGDVRHRTLLSQCMAGVDLVYHLAAQSSVLDAVQDPDYTFETNVVGTYEVLRAASRAGVKRVIFSSSREVYGEPASLPVPETAAVAPNNAYGASKAAAEMSCRSFSCRGMEVVILRLTNVYGTRDQGRVIPLFSRKALTREPLTVFGGGKILDFLWINHLIDALCRAAQGPCPDTPVNLGSGQGTSLVKLAERVSSLAGFFAAVQVGDLRPCEVSRFIADVTIAKRLFNLQCPADPIKFLPLILDQINREVQCVGATNPLAASSHANHV
jgi:UDP-glucose 4-epimerase